MLVLTVLETVVDVSVNEEKPREEEVMISIIPFPSLVSYQMP